MTTTFLEALHADPWGEVFLDLPALNAGTSDVIEQAAARVREQARTQHASLRSSALVVLGPAGAGKTHLFSRLRRRLGPRAVFVHVRPLIASDITPRFVLHEVVRQLALVTGGVRQLEVLVGSLLAHVAGRNVQFPRAVVEEVRQTEKAERERLLEDALEQVLAWWPTVDESVLLRLLRCPFDDAPTQRAALAWLSGRDCDDVQLRRLGVSASMGEEVIIPALRTIAGVAAPGAPLVVVFDQLENLVDGSGPGRIHAYANVAAELVDVVHGVVVVQMALDTEWARAIAPVFNLAQKSRLDAHRTALALPSAKQREELLRLWSENLPEPREPFPWPWNEQRIATWCQAPGMTPRMLLLACRRALEGEDVAASTSPDATPSTPAESVAQATESLDELLRTTWDQHVEAARAELDAAARENRPVDSARLVDGIVAAAEFVPGLEVKSVHMNEPAQVQLMQGTKCLYLALLQQAAPRTVGSTLTKLLALAGSQAVLVARERTQDFKPTWKDCLEKRRQLGATPHGRWCHLERDDLANLLALASMVKAARSRDVEGAGGLPLEYATVVDWLRLKLGIASWPFVQVLTGQAQVPTEPVDVAPDVPPKKPSVAPAARVDVVRATLARLRVASIDRLVREVRRVDPTATHASVIARLTAEPAGVRRYGSALFAFVETP